MARPINKGLDYFPLDTDIDQDDKIALVESDFGVEGFGIVIKLLMKAYSNGYFYEWGEKEQKLFVRRVNVDINTLSAVVNACIRWGVFDRHIFERFEVLTSRGIQKRYLEATTRRKDVELYEEYILLSKTEIAKYSNVVIVNIEDHSLGEDVDIYPHSNDQMLTKTTQSKVKESKGKKSKAEESIAAAPAVMNAHLFYQENFGMQNPTVMQTIEFWIEDLNEELVIEAMRRAAIDQKGFRYAEGIMKNWDKKNIRTMEQVEAEDISFNNRKQNNNNFGNNQKVEQLPAWANEPQPTVENEMDEEIQQEFLDRLQRFREGNPN